jgi:phosphatidylserine decarboxylase
VSWLDSILVPVNREGFPFVAFGAVIALVLFFLYDPLGWAGVLVTLGLVFIFPRPGPGFPGP